MLRYTIQALRESAIDHAQSVVDIPINELTNDHPFKNDGWLPDGWRPEEPIILTETDMIPDISELFPDDISAA